MKPMIIPVIHHADDRQAIRNGVLALEAGCDGVMLIQMEGDNARLPSVARVLKGLWPNRLVGINFLGMDPVESIRANIANGLDMTWTDEQLTHSSLAPWDDASDVALELSRSDGHLLFAGVAFKHQRPEPDPATAVRKAVDLGFVPTTSGTATGIAADIGKIRDLRAEIGQDVPLAIASGITPENVADYAPYLSHILVATGISASFHEIDIDRLFSLLSSCGRNAFGYGQARG